MQSENIDDQTRTVGLRTNADDLQMWDAQTAIIAEYSAQFLTPLLVKDSFINLL